MACLSGQRQFREIRPGRRRQEHPDERQFLEPNQQHAADKGWVTAMVAPRVAGDARMHQQEIEPK